MNLIKLEIDRDETKGRTIPYLSFTVEIKLDDSTKLRYWLVDNVFNQLWATFEAAQMTLVPSVVDAEHKGASDKVN